MAKPKRPKRKPKRPKPKPKPTGYSWIMDKDGVVCFSGGSGQTVARLWEADSLSKFHDERLAEATKEINAILERVERSKPSDDHELSFVEFQDRHMLVWATYGAVSPYDEDDVIAEALGLTGRSYRPRS